MQELAERLVAAQKTIAVAESCTGGFVANWITDLPGASRYFSQGVVVYSNQSKKDLLGVSEKTLEAFGAVSEMVAKEMAQGLLKRAHTDYAIAITGIAGPTGAGPAGGSTDKPIGTLFIACANATHCRAQKFYFPTERLEFKRQAAEAALHMMLESL